MPRSAIARNSSPDARRDEQRQVRPGRTRCWSARSGAPPPSPRPGRRPCRRARSGRSGRACSGRRRGSRRRRTPRRRARCATARRPPRFTRAAVGLDRDPPHAPTVVVLGMRLRDDQRVALGRERHAVRVAAARRATRPRWRRRAATRKIAGFSEPVTYIVPSSANTGEFGSSIGRSGRAGRVGGPRAGRRVDAQRPRPCASHTRRRCPRRRRPSRGCCRRCSRPRSISPSSVTA